MSSMMKVMARACGRCKKYIVIHSEDARNQSQIQQFEADHAGHMLITAQLDEVEDSGYVNVQQIEQ